jgi:uncharacterized membrane protein
VVTSNERQIFSYLHGNGPSLMRDIVRTLKLCRGTAHHAVLRLERRGLAGSNIVRNRRVCWSVEGPL